MNAPVDESLKRLHELVAELEARARSAAEAAGEAEQKLTRDVGRGARAANEFVSGNVWLSIGIAAAVAFVLGALFARRD